MNFGRIDVFPPTTRIVHWTWWLCGIISVLSKIGVGPASLISQLKHCAAFFMAFRVCFSPHHCPLSTLFVQGEKHYASDDAMGVYRNTETLWMSRVQVPKVSPWLTDKLFGCLVPPRRKSRDSNCTAESLFLSLTGCCLHATPSFSTNQRRSRRGQSGTQSVKLWRQSRHKPPGPGSCTACTTEVRANGVLSKFSIFEGAISTRLLLSRPGRVMWDYIQSRSVNFKYHRREYKLITENASIITFGAHFRPIKPSRTQHFYHSSFFIFHSSFFILHSSFFIFHSSLSHENFFRFVRFDLKT